MYSGADARAMKLSLTQIWDLNRTTWRVLMRMTVDYARSIGYKGDFYIEPKPKEPTKLQYDFDTATVLGFLRKYGLDKDFK